MPTTATAATDVTLHRGKRCLHSRDGPVGGEVLISLQDGAGVFRPAYRYWRDAGANEDVAGTVIGNFDFNGDGKMDIAFLRGTKIEVVNGRAPSDATLSKLTLACDSAFVSNALPAKATSLSAVGDLDGDGCTDRAAGFGDTTTSGVFVVFGADAGGARCNGHSSSATILLTTEPGAPYGGLGISIASGGRFFRSTGRVIAVGAKAVFVADITNPGGLDVAKVLTLRLAGADGATGAIANVSTRAFTTREVFDGFGASLAGEVDVDGDGIVDLVVGAPSATLAADRSGGAFVFRGGAASSGMLVPYLVIAGDDGIPSSFGISLGVSAAASANEAWIGVGSPSSARNGADNGAAYLLAVP